MKLPLNNWATIQRGYRFGSKTFYNDFHIGLDLIVPTGRTVYAHLSGVASTVVDGSQVGNCVHLVGSDGRLVRYAHLSRFGKTGKVNEGDIIGYTGNSGLSTAPHLHIDVSMGNKLILSPSNFIDPEKYFKEGDLTMSQYNELKALITKIHNELLDNDYKNGVVLNNKIAALQKQIDGLKAVIISGTGLSNEDADAISVLKKFLNWLQSFWRKGE